jgi:hypothetical protein
MAHRKKLYYSFGGSPSFIQLDQWGAPQPTHDSGNLPPGAGPFCILRKRLAEGSNAISGAPAVGDNDDNGNLLDERPASTNANLKATVTVGGWVNESVTQADEQGD